jgi:hypothetical protein
LLEVPERHGDRRHRFGQCGSGPGLPDETRLHPKAFGFLGLPLHVDFIWNRGAYIMEILNLDDLAKDGHTSSSSPWPAAVEGRDRGADESHRPL